jgi:hypothetical protein
MGPNGHVREMERQEKRPRGRREGEEPDSDSHPPLRPPKKLVACLIVLVLGVGATTSLACMTGGYGTATNPDSAGPLVKAGHRRITALGRFHPRRNPTLRAAIHAFGGPTSRRPRLDHHTCSVSWKDRRLRIKFDNYDGLNACSRRGGLAQSMVIRRSPRWHTTRNLRVGQTAFRLGRLYPRATRHGDLWWLRTAFSPIANGGRYALLAARVDHGRVSGFKGWIDAAGE